MASKGVEGKKLVYCTIDNIKYSVYVDSSTNHDLNSNDPLVKAQSQKIVIDAVKATRNEVKDKDEQEDTSDRNTLTFCDVCGQGIERGVIHRCPDIQQSEDEETVKEDVTGTNNLIIWSKNNTLFLISEYKKNKDKIEKGRIRKKVVWEKISTILQQRGFRVNAEQVNGKWKTLMRGYKSVKDNNKKSGAGRKSFEFEDDLDDLFEKDPIVKPLLTLSSTDLYKATSGTCNTENTLSDEKAKEDKSSPKPSEKDKSSSNPPSKKRRGASSDIVDTFKEYISETRGRQEEAIERQERMHQERMKAYRGVEDALRSFLTQKKS